MDEQKTKPHIVILGGGFGGIYVYKYLAKHFRNNTCNITIINNTNYFLFTPLLHEVATGSLSHHQVVESLRELIYKRGGNLMVADILSIDTEINNVRTSIGSIKYDYLIIATGATTQFFKTPGAEENSFVLKNLHDAIKLRNHFIDNFEKASGVLDVDKRKAMLRVAVVGGGPTGVELVTEIADLYLKTFAKYYKKKVAKWEMEIMLVSKGGEILNALHKNLREDALKIIKDKGIKVMLNTGVKEVGKNVLEFDNGEKLECGTIVWCAGVRPMVPESGGKIELDEVGRVITDSTLRVKNFQNIFAIGDVARVVDARDNPQGTPLPMLAQVAEREAPVVAENIIRSIKNKKLVPFTYHSQGELVSLGTGEAVARIFGISFSGPFAWFIWRTVYLFKFISHSKKLKIAVDWTTNLFFPRDITRA